LSRKKVNAYPVFCGFSLPRSYQCTPWLGAIDKARNSEIQLEDRIHLTGFLYCINRLIILETEDYWSLLGPSILLADAIEP
jgi:hypothetical protein